ncbi:MAG: hypothetical protein K8R89_02110 [Anaerolineae bacterium]|nr:hypothetical protein [Anaerolineae bacterium]
MKTDSVPEHTSSEKFRTARRTTFLALSEINEETLLSLTRLTLPEIREIRREVARIMPAGNLPALILSGLIQMRNRKITAIQVKKDVTALLRGMDFLPQGLYGVFVAGPSAVLYGYQQLLRLAGRDIKDAFPQGTWQFYLEYALREDSAHHTNETWGFHHALSPALPTEVMAAAWVWTALELLYTYDDLLSLVWRERVMLRGLHVALVEAEAERIPSWRVLTNAWARVCPYHRPAHGGDYIRYRATTFEHFLQRQMSVLPAALRREVWQRYATQQRTALPAYQEQMTLLTRLRPTRYREERIPLPLWQAAVGFIWQGESYLLPACDCDVWGHPLCTPPGDEGVPPFPLEVREDKLFSSAGQELRVDHRGRVLSATGKELLGVLNPPSPQQILGWVRAILALPAPDTTPELDLLLAEIPRCEHPGITATLPAPVSKDLAALERAPVLINWDRHSSRQPLHALRRDHRGVGSHALTVFHTEHSMIFDQSHIFFDGLWGMVVAEILTDAATHACRRFVDVTPDEVATPVPLQLSLLAARLQHLRTRCIAPGVSAEATAGDLRQIYQLRRWLRKRGIRLTINDILLLYRYFHAQVYRPGDVVAESLKGLAERLPAKEYAQIRQSIEEAWASDRTTNPALLIPMDATQVAPHERIYPTTFRNPLTDLPVIFEGVQSAYSTYRRADSNENWEEFDRQRRVLLAYLQVFGNLLGALKDVTMRGESLNVATLQLLGHLPPAMQHLLDGIPRRIGVLNEVLKGSEVFSNVGRVAVGSTLRRFNSAKDDGAAKELVWGILTDDQGILHLSLRDFRSFVALLWEHDEVEVARALTQDYLVSYARGLNAFVKMLGQVVTAKQG